MEEVGWQEGQTATKDLDSSVGIVFFYLPQKLAMLEIKYNCLSLKQKNMHILEDVCGQSSIKEIQINWVCIVKVYNVFLKFNIGVC